MNFFYISASETGLKRKNNEDAFGVYEIEGGLLAVVCDGLGGNKAGEIASNLTVETIYNHFSNSTEKDYLKRIISSISEANHLVLNKSNGNFSLKGMATTVEVLFLINHCAYWGHVGDSRIYCWENKKLKQLTKDHSYVQKLVDDGFITLKEAENHPNKNIITRALGDEDHIEIDSSKINLHPSGEIKFLLCSDGVTNVIDDDRLSTILAGKDLEAVSKKIKSEVEKKGAPDNFTYVIIRVSDQ
jgi:PPM family protein phosphatase